MHHKYLPENIFLRKLTVYFHLFIILLLWTVHMTFIFENLHIKREDHISLQKEILKINRVNKARLYIVRPKDNMVSIFKNTKFAHMSLKVKDKLSIGQRVYFYDDHVNILYKTYMISIDEQSVNKISLPTRYIYHKTYIKKDILHTIKSFGIWQNKININHKSKHRERVNLLIKQTIYQGRAISSKLIYINFDNRKFYSQDGINFVSKEDCEYIFPTASKRITGYYGYRHRHPISGIPKIHNGIDIGDKIGSTIYSTASGRVKFTGWKGGYGKTIIIKHDNGSESLYAHLSNIQVKNGQYIQQGIKIGAMGATGNVTGPHLHFEIRQNNKPINPLNVLNKSKAIPIEIVKECKKHIE